MPRRAVRVVSSDASMSPEPDGDAHMSDVNHNDSKTRGNADSDYQTASLSQNYVSSQNFGNTTNAPRDIKTAASSASIESLGSKAKKLVNAVNKLEQIGIEREGLPLPKIVVLGDQSAGKSSLIEAITEIKVPRSSGVCTRCPLQISITQADSWSCSVALHRKYYYVPNDHSEKFGPWKALDRPEETDPVAVDDKTMIEPMLEMAQVACLHPGDDPHRLMSGHKPRAKGVKFSPNIIKLDICGPSLPTLTIYDLPGIISRDDEDDSGAQGHLPGLVKGLAQHYIQNDNTIVLLTCPMGQDPATSHAGSLLKFWRAAPRTIGVLTKPDHLPKDDTVDQWTAMLKGKSFPVGYEYFVTKQLSTQEIKQGLDHAEARRLEAEFFANTAPFNNHPDFVACKNRFGTYKLRDRLSQLLADETAKGLPIIKEKVGQRLGIIEEKLQNLPKPDPNCLTIVTQIVDDARLEFSKILTGEPPFNGLILEWREHIKTFRNELEALKPAVIVKTGPELMWQQRSNTDPICIDSDDEESMPMPPSGTSTTTAKSSFADSPNTPSSNKRQKLSNGRFTPVPRSAKAMKFRFPELRTKIREMSSSDLPTSNNPYAEDHLIKQSLHFWNETLSRYEEAVANSIQNKVEMLLDELLGAWKDTQLFGETRRITLEILHEVHERHCDNTNNLLQATHFKPIATNEDHLEELRKKELQLIQAHRRQARAKAFLEFTGKQENERSLRGVTDKDLGDDPFTPEIEVVARIRGYYCLTADELVNSISRLTRFDVFEGFRKKLGTALPEALGLRKENAAENCRLLLAEDPRREAERARLLGEQKKLKEAKRLLDDLVY